MTYITIHNETYLQTQSNPFRAVMPHGKNRIKVAAEINGEIQVKSRCHPATHNTLKSIMKWRE